MTNLITPNELQQVWKAEFTADLIRKSWQADLRYDVPTREEFDTYLNGVVNTIFEELTAAGPKRINQWEAGWEQNLEEFKRTRNLESLVAKYHGKYDYLRWRQRIIKPLNPKFDYNIHCLLVDWAISAYLSDVEGIYEFGCGPAYHLLRARQINPKAMLVGLDWTKASQRIIEELKDEGIPNIWGHNFDFYEPNYDIDIASNSGVITIAALEQTGCGFKSFIDYLLVKKPKVCVHIEPIDELVDTNNLIDNLSVLYCRKRKYLNGFLPYLQRLQKEKQIEIINQQRTFTGSQYIEGHSLVVWRPIEL